MKASETSRQGDTNTRGLDMWQAQLKLIIGNVIRQLFQHGAVDSESVRSLPHHWSKAVKRELARCPIRVEVSTPCQTMSTQPGACDCLGVVLQVPAKGTQFNSLLPASLGGANIFRLPFGDRFGGVAF